MHVSLEWPEYREELSRVKLSDASSSLRHSPVSTASWSSAGWFILCPVPPGHYT